MHPTFHVRALVLPLALAAAASHAHDTWFEPLPSPRKGETAFALGTGNRFPVFELGVDTRYFAKSGCRAGTRSDRLGFVTYADKQTQLRTPLAGPALTCWLQLDPFEFELPADKIEVYFKEIRPNAAVLATWADLKARGLPFIERYTKSARYDGASAAPAPTGTAMDVLREAPAGALAVGTEATFQVLREGRPLADFNVELVNERSPIGLWHRTDAQGRIRARLPLPGRWLLRGTDLRLSTRDATKWESQFVTYAFSVN
ncbi:MAG TPA: DUF4198 domain-containing protein [Burkholderiaceae bacterium]|nr:DUF4198 domain-containing protein [Burkholderiaceae bacterium]